MPHLMVPGEGSGREAEVPRRTGFRTPFIFRRMGNLTLPPNFTPNAVSGICSKHLEFRVHEGPRRSSYSDARFIQSPAAAIDAPTQLRLLVTPVDSGASQGQRTVGEQTPGRIWPGRSRESGS